MEWAREISEGTHMGTTTHQGAPGAAGVPWCLVGTRCTPSVVICTSNSEIFRKIVSNFQNILRTFIFGSFFYCTTKTENRIIMPFLFYLTN